MLKREMRSLVLAFTVLSWGSLAHAQGTFTVDTPGATFTRIFGLNAQGDICGATFVNGVRLAFTGSRHAEFGDLTTFAYPGAVFTVCRDVNAAGQLVGFYQSADTKFHAFVRDGAGFISIDAPGAIDTRGFSIDPRGQIVGRYTGPDGHIHGFFQDRDGSFVTIDVPGATATEASGITPQGDITGLYQTPDKKLHVYILSKDGFEAVDVPGAANTGSPTGGVWMSASGELAGYYLPEGGASGNRAWIRLRDGAFHTYSYPDAADTCFLKSNERGDLVGRYIANGVEHGLYVERLGRRPVGQ
jgi:hypothetical protein